MVFLENIAFQALSMAVLGAFCWMVYAYRGQVGRCLKSTVAFSHATNPRPDAVAVYDRFLTTALTLGALSAGVAAAKVASVTPGGMTLWESSVGLAPMLVAPAVAGAVALAVVVVEVVEVAILKAAGGLTFARKFTDEVIAIKKNWMAATSILTVPLVAMWTGVNPGRDGIVAYALVGVIVTTAVLFVTHTLQGFIRQKVSLLVWFLYLCTVEILPVCAVMLAVARNMYNT